MSCTNCSTSQSPKGCKNNGSCASGSCNKLSVFDWLSDISMPDGHPHDYLVEIQFKNNHKDFFTNPHNIKLKIGMFVVTQAQNGYDIGQVTLTGALVKIQMKKKKIEDSENLQKILRIASSDDLEQLKKCREKEQSLRKEACGKALFYNLKMNVSDVEFQGDGSKALFYYTAKGRIDFRQLVKDLASRFNIRIEMKQIGLREEASRLGGIGICGRELCCSSWLSSYESINISAAKYQDLSLNPQKLAGQCGKLKCCLNYELDTYSDALKLFPKKNTVLHTEKGKAFCQKIDIFNQFLWYSYQNSSENWIKLGLKEVNTIINKNKNKQSVTTLEEYQTEKNITPKVVDLEFKDVIADNSLSRFDKSLSGRKNNKRKNNKRPNNASRS